MRHFRRFLKRYPVAWAIASLLLVGAVSTILLSPSVHAAYGSENFQGYFTGQQEFSGDIVLPNGLPNSVADAGSFTTYIRNDLNSGTAHEKTAAAFIILTMMGYPTGTPKSQANAVEGQWETLIDQYAAQNLIQWNATISWSGSNCPNTFYETSYDDVADFSFCDYNGAAGVEFMSPSNPSQVLYTIKRNCGNPVGNFQKLPPPDPQPVGYVDSYCTPSKTIRGWALDQSKITQSIFVDVYVNGAFWQRVTANTSRPDVATAYPGAGNNHGFDISWDTARFPLTSTYTVKVYAIGIDGSGALNGANPQIGVTGTVSGAGCGVSASPLACPGQPGKDMTKVPVTLSPSTGNTTTVSSDGQTETVRYVTGYNIISVKDSNTGTDLKYTPSSPISGTGQVTIYVDFSPSVTAFPYDSNQATVTYTTNYASYTYPLLPDGSWSTTPNGTGPSGTWPANGTFSSTGSLGECYYRNFNVLPPSSTDVEGVTLSYSGRPNDENPNQAVVNTQVDVRFTLTPVSGAQKQLRAPMSVAGLNYSASYQIRRPVPGTNSYQIIPLSPASQSVPQISCPTTSTDCTVPYAFSPTPITVSVGSGSSQLRPGDIVCAQFTISPAIGTSPNYGGTDEGGNIRPGSSGSVDSTRIPGGSTCSSPLVNKPYFKVFGGDISVGNPFALGGTCNLGGASAGVYGWNTEDGGNGYPSHPYAGAGAQYAVTALAADSKDVASNQFNPNSSYPTPGNSRGIELSFANSGTSPSSGKFVSSFGAAQSCIPDYFAGAASAPGGAPSSNVSSLASGSYDANGNITLSGGNIATGKHITIYAAGNVYINGDIKFANSSYTSIDSVPSFVVVAKGNIYISSGVKELTGVYIAEPSSTTSSDGVISDCATAGGPLPDDQLYTKCNTPLTVNGSFIANKIELLRTTTGDPGPYNENASIRGAQTGETNSTAATMTVDAVQTVTCSSGTPDNNGYCGYATPHTTTTSGYSYSASSYTTYSCPSGTSLWNGRCYNTNCGTGNSYYEGNCYRNSDGKLLGAASSSPATATTTYYCPNGGSLSGTTCTVASSSSTYYTCPSGETVSGNRCQAKVTYTCPDGSNAPPSHKCTVTIVPTHASEVFNYNPAFWMNVALPTPGSQGSSYDAITSLPPVL